MKTRSLIAPLFAVCLLFWASLGVIGMLEPEKPITMVVYCDCNGDGIVDCTAEYVSFYGIRQSGGGCASGCREYSFGDVMFGSVSLNKLPECDHSTISAPPSSIPSFPEAVTPFREPDPPAEQSIRFGGYSLKFTNLIKCASVQERPYTAMIVRAVDGKSWLHLPEVLLDSGADISILPISIAGVLGIDLSDCETRQYHGVGGGVVLGYLTEVQIGITHLGSIDPDVDGYILAKDGKIFLPVISVAFVDDDSNYILGRIDVFDLFDLTFTSDTVTIQVAD